MDNSNKSFKFSQNITLDNGRKKKCECTVITGEKKNTSIQNGNIKDMLKVATQKIGTNTKVGSIEQINYNPSDLKCVCSLDNTINLNVEKGYNLYQTIAILIGLSTIIYAFSYKKQNKDNPQSNTPFLIILAVGIIIITIGNYIFSNNTNISNWYTYIILFFIIVTIVMGIYSINEPTEDDLKKYSSKFSYYIDKIFSKNLSYLITGAAFLASIFWALGITITIPYFIILLLVGMNLVVFGSVIINTVVSMIDYFNSDNGSWNFNSSFWNWGALIATGLAIYLHYKFYEGKIGKCTLSKMKWAKLLLGHSDGIMLFFFLITTIFSFSRVETNKLPFNNALLSFVVSIIIMLVYNKNYNILDLHKNDIFSNKNNKSMEIRLGAGTGIFSDLLSKLYKVLFSKNQFKEDQQTLNIGDEPSSSNIYYWVVLYFYLQYFANDEVATEYDPALFRTIFAIILTFGKLCLGSFSTTDDKTIENLCKKI